MLDWHIHGLGGSDNHRDLGHHTVVILVEPMLVHDNSIDWDGCNFPAVNQLFQLRNGFQLHTFLA